jgi:hypothetical protein
MTTIRTALPGLGLAFGFLLGAWPALGSSRSEAAPTAREIERLEGEARNAGLGPELLRLPIGEARRALDRARGARAAGDEPHGALLDRLAGEWLALGSATLRAVRAENAAGAATKRTVELRTKLERGRALLVEDQARQGRLQAEVRRLEQERAASSSAKPPPGRAGGKGTSAATSAQRSDGSRAAFSPAPMPSTSHAPKKGGASAKEGKP